MTFHTDFKFSCEYAKLFNQHTIRNYGKLFTTVSLKHYMTAFYINILYLLYYNIIYIYIYIYKRLWQHHNVPCVRPPLNRDPWVCLGVKFARAEQKWPELTGTQTFHFRDAERHGHILGCIIPRVISILNAIYCFSLSCKKIFLFVLALGNSVKNNITLDDETGFVLFVLIVQITEKNVFFFFFTELWEVFFMSGLQKHTFTDMLANRCRRRVEIKIREQFMNSWFFSEIM